MKIIFLIGIGSFIPLLSMHIDKYERKNSQGLHEVGYKGTLKESKDFFDVTKCGNVMVYGTRVPSWNNNRELPLSSREAQEYFDQMERYYKAQQEKKS